jgi:hypothetical protein
MDCVGKGGRHLRSNLAVSQSVSQSVSSVHFEEGGSVRTECSLEFQGCSRFGGGLQKLVGYQAEGVRGHVCVPCK